MLSSSGIANQHPAGGPALSEPPFIFEQGSLYGSTQNPSYSLTTADSHTGSEAPPNTSNGTSLQTSPSFDQSSQHQANQQYSSPNVPEQYSPGNPPAQQYNRQQYGWYQQYNQQPYGGYGQPSVHSGYQSNGHGQGGYGVHHQQPQNAAYPLSSWGWASPEQKRLYEQQFFQGGIANAAPSARPQDYYTQYPPSNGPPAVSFSNASYLAAYVSVPWSSGTMLEDWSNPNDTAPSEREWTPNAPNNMYSQ